MCKSSTKKTDAESAIAELKEKLKNIKFENLLFDEPKKRFAGGCVVAITLEPTIEVEVMEAMDEKQ